MIKDTHIRTYSGLYVDVFNPDPDSIILEDIVHALAQQCRFGGHYAQFYSVAQHSVMCSYLMGADKYEFKLAALMHDASEAYLLDIPRPIKRQLNNYLEIEDKLMSVIAKKFGFVWPLQPEVKAIDETLLNLEWDNWVNDKSLITYWSYYQTRENFFGQYHLLTRKFKTNA